MDDLAELGGLRDRILVLLSLPALALGCTAKAPPEADAKPAASQTDPEPDEPDELVAPSTAIEPEPELPPAADTDTDTDTDTAPLPPGAQFCFGLEDAKTLAEAEAKTDETSACPTLLHLADVRSRVETWDRRTGGPWNESVKFVASDTPEGQGQRCCYEHAYARVPGTRPMRGRPLFAPGPEGERLVVPELVASAPSPSRWLEDARAELASVAAFARANLELMAHAAPPTLIRANLRAAVDELEHTRLCLARAGAPGPILGALEPVAARTMDLAELGSRTLLEACIPETLGALAAARAAAQARAAGRLEDAEARDQIARDEARHAALAWAVLRWAKSASPAVDARLAELEGAARRVIASVLAVEPSLDPGEANAIWTELVSPLA